MQSTNVQLWETLWPWKAWLLSRAKLPHPLKHHQRWSRWYTRVFSLQSSKGAKIFPGPWTRSARPPSHSNVFYWSTWLWKWNTSLYIFVSGLYSPERSGRSIFRTAPAYSLSGREKEGSRKQTPGSVLFGVSFLWAWVSLQKQYKLCLAPTQVQRLIVCLLCWGPKLWPYLQLQPGHSVVALKAGASTRTYRRYIWKQLPWEVKAILFHIL